MRTAVTKKILTLALFAIALPVAAASGEAEVGKKKSTACAACHGANGIGISPDFPNLAGQYEDYLETALKHYKLGKRKNAIMQGQVANLSQKDIMDLAAYYASLNTLQVKH